MLGSKTGLDRVLGGWPLPKPRFGQGASDEDVDSTSSFSMGVEAHCLNSSGTLSQTPSQNHSVNKDLMLFRQDK